MPPEVVANADELPGVGGYGTGNGAHPQCQYSPHTVGIRQGVQQALEARTTKIRGQNDHRESPLGGCPGAGQVASTGAPRPGKRAAS